MAAWPQAGPAPVSGPGRGSGPGAESGCPGGEDVSVPLRGHRLLIPGLPQRPAAQAVVGAELVPALGRPPLTNSRPDARLFPHLNLSASAQNYH